MADLLARVSTEAAARGAAPALIHGKEAIGFQALTERAAGFAAKLKAAGVKTGDRALLAMPVGIDLFIAIAGAWAAGLTLVFPEPALGLSGLRHAVSTTRPRALIATGRLRWMVQGLAPALWRVPVLAPDDTRAGTDLATAGPEATALISFTSGSTGAPKAIPRSHDLLAAQCAALEPILASDKPETDLVGFPVMTLVNLAAGRSSALPTWNLARPERLSPAALAAAATQAQATRALLPPALCGALAAAPDTPSLLTVFTGGGPVTPALVKRLHARGLRVVSVYGSTEAEPIAALDWAEVSEADRADMAAGGGLLAGAPVPPVALRLSGHEIEVTGAHVSKGYLDPAQDAETKRRDGEVIWHRTGDAGRLDADNRLWLLGRAGAVRTACGATLFPFAVEQAAAGWPGVRAAALTTYDTLPTLAIAGAPGHGPAWVSAARALGIPQIAHVRRIPKDRRHGSKTDYATLARRLRRPFFVSKILKSGA